jgi:hypothetical protein
MTREKKLAYGPIEARPQEEMTVIVVKFKGGAESMQKGFDTVNNAITSLGPAQQRVVITSAPAQLPSATSAQNGHVTDAEIEEAGAATTDDAEHVTPASAALAAPTKPRKGYTFMSDFNLSPAGLPSLKEYCAEKSPQIDNDKFLVAGAWIQTHGGADLFTGRHLFTAFRAMEWKTQVDMTKPMRRLKSQKSYFENLSNGKWKLTGIGLEAAEKITK